MNRPALMHAAQLIAALFVLASASTASAECTWVLWSALTTPTLPDEGWGVVTAYPTMKECEVALADEFARQKREGWQVNYVRNRTVVAFKGAGEKIAMQHYRCLPDTVDPRAPKGK